MKFRYVFALVAFLFSVCTHAAEKVEKPVEVEDPMEKLFNDSECQFCHYDGYQDIGPALIEISLKYKNDKDAPTTLAKKIREGGSGVWGVLPMPATSADVSDETIKTLTTWILARKNAPNVGEILFEHNVCFQCHFDEKRTVGPSLVEIAKKYKDDKSARKNLLVKVREGGSGVWGNRGMPPTTVKKLSDDGINILVDWMLEFKPTPKTEKGK